MDFIYPFFLFFFCVCVCVCNQKQVECGFILEAIIAFYAIPLHRLVPKKEKDNNFVDGAKLCKCSLCNNESFVSLVKKDINLKPKQS